MIYSEIVDLALGYSDRQDSEVTSRVDLFLKIVEARVNRLLMTMDMSTRAKTIMDSGTEFYSLPSNYSVLRAIKVISNVDSSFRKTLTQVNPEQMANIVDNGVTDALCYTVISGSIQVRPLYDNTHSLEIDYFQTLPSLTSSNISNWLSISNPDTYVFGLLTEINSFVKDPDATMLWNERFNQSLSEITMNDAKSTWSGTALQTIVG